MAGHGFLGCGTLYGEVILQGVGQGMVALGNSTKFEIKSNGSIQERISKQCSTYGQAADSVFVASPSDISIDLDELNKTSLAAAFLGTPSDVSVAGATHSAEPHTVPPTLPAIIQLDFPNASSIVVKSAGGATTYVAGTDYNVINAQAGLIEILAGGGIAAGSVPEIDYTGGVSTSVKIDGNTKSDVKMHFLLVGQNKADGKGFTAEVYDTTINPSSFDFLADSFTKLSLSGKVNVSASGKTYTVTTDIVNA
jgi:hypothetical protein